MDNIQIFKNESFGEVRVAGTSEEPLFCLADVCKVLELGNPSQVKTRLCGEVITNEVIPDSLGRQQEMIFINEDGLYDVILDELMRYGMTATQPTLEQMINNPDLVISLAQNGKREEKQRLALEVEKKEQEKLSIIEETKPAVVFTECVTSSSTNILIGDLAKLITQNGNFRNGFSHCKSQGVVIHDTPDAMEE